VKDKLTDIKVGFQAYVREGGDPFGAVRAVAPGGRDEIVIYVENGGDFVLPSDAVTGAHDGKVILDETKLDERVRDAIAHAHDQEKPGL
jgi:hypothetical protein